MTEGVVVVAAAAAAAVVVVSAEVAVVAVSVGYLIDGPIIIIYHNTNLIINNYSFCQAIMIYDLKEYKHMLNFVENF